MESPESWDAGTPIPYERGKQPRRALVSIPFQPGEFAQVTLGAERSGEKLSVFIRNAALHEAEALIEAEVRGLSYSEPDNNTVTITVGESTVFPISESEKAGTAWFEPYPVEEIAG